MCLIFILDINECVQENICQNGGTCFNRPGSFYCSCAQGWTGTLCETGKPFHNLPPPSPKSLHVLFIYVCRISGLISIIWYFFIHVFCRCWWVCKQHLPTWRHLSEHPWVIPMSLSHRMDWKVLWKRSVNQMLRYNPVEAWSDNLIVQNCVKKIHGLIFS